MVSSSGNRSTPEQVPQMKHLCRKFFFTRLPKNPARKNLILLTGLSFRQFWWCEEVQQFCFKYFRCQKLIIDHLKPLRLFWFIPRSKRALLFWILRNFLTRATKRFIVSTNLSLTSMTKGNGPLMGYYYRSTSHKRRKTERRTQETQRWNDFKLYSKAIPYLN